ncbi:MAG: hemerythrin domain-containing protein [Gammaproteobacteria bacterium]|nr:hemerythrin domain-containing protein [Gammaproteobacteria bacterium]
MTTVTEFFTKQHRECDAILEQMEQALNTHDWGLATQKYDAMQQDIFEHLANEEDSLFPMFEEKSGMRGGPVSVMLGEHIEIKALVERIGHAITAQDLDEALDTMETLFMFLQQHNVKEEQMLYPMTDEALQDSLHELKEKIKGFE